MGIHIVSYYEESDGMELVDIAYQCSQICMFGTLAADLSTEDIDREVSLSLAGTLNTSDGGSVSWGAFPCGSETDYDVYCSACEQLLWHGLGHEDNEE